MLCRLGIVLKTMSMIPSLEIKGRVAIITLCRPDVANRLESEDLLAIIKHIETINNNHEILVLLLKAQGKYFCSGYNLNEVDGDSNGSHFQTAPNAIDGARPITIALMNGPAFGGATDLALACDFRFGIKDCFIQVPAAKIGLHFYQTGLERYISRVGINAAKKILIACQKMPADELKANGFLDEVFENVDELNQAGDKLANEIAGFAPLSIIGMKKHINKIAIGKIDADELLNDMQKADDSNDLKEGLLAMREKRLPIFKGI